MKKTFLSFRCAAYLALTVGTMAFASGMESRELKTFDFSRKADGEFQQVTIPHSMNADNGVGTVPLERGDAYYKLVLPVSKADLEQDFILQFEQVAQVAEVYLNGTLLHKNYSGYAPFAVKLTGAKEGENTILIHTDNRKNPKNIPSSGDFNFVNGMLGKAFLLTGELYFDPLVYGIDRAHVIPVSVESDQVTFGLAASVFSRSKSGTAQVTVELANADGKTVVKQVVPLAVIPGNNEFYKEFTFRNPILWQGMENPYLYHLKATVALDGKSFDALDIPYGFRNIQPPFNPKNALLRINGKPIRLRGVCMHQDFPDAAAAMTEADRDVDRAILKEIGCNWIRCAHYPHNVNEYVYYDKVGMMNQSEIPWVNYFDESPEFAEHVKQYMHDMINNLYNHPSIILWGVSNEVAFQKYSDKAVRLHNEAYVIGRQLDPYRPVGFVSYRKELPRVEKNGLIADWYGNNSYPGWYTGKKKKNFEHDRDLVDSTLPLAKFYVYGISEYGFGGNPACHNSDYMTVHPNSQSNTYGTSIGHRGVLHPEEYQTFGHVYSWNILCGTPKGRRLTFTSIWNLFDFAVDARDEGGTPGINDKGIVTRDRKIKKDAFYFYKCVWNPTPEVHIVSSRWLVRDTPTIDVTVFSNAERVELLRNGEKIKELNAPSDSVNKVVWKFPAIEFSQGAKQGTPDVFTAIGYRNGKVIAQDTAKFSTTYAGK